MRLRREIHSYVPLADYQRLQQEAAARGASLSKCVADCLREYLALGLVVLGTDAGGASEHMLPEASITARAGGSEEEVARLILRLSGERGWLRELRAMAWARRRSALWAESVTQISALWPRLVEVER